MAPQIDAPDALIQKINLYSALRQVIQHEDDLVNQRFTWLLTFEGFLLAGFFVVQSGMLGNIHRSYVVITEVSLAAVLIGSLWICFITGQLIAAATTQVSLVGKLWKQRYKEENWADSRLPQWYRFAASPTPENKLPAACELPPIHGEFKLSGASSVTAVPFVLLLLNSIAALACIAIAVWRYNHV